MSRARALASGARLLAEPAAAAELLAFACEQAGVRLVDHRLRSVHRRSGSSVSHVFEARIDLGPEQRDVLLVAHVDPRGFPEGAFVSHDGATSVAVWRFPHDPYLPGLPSAIDTGRVRALLDRLSVGPGPVRLRTRSYRPSRRAVVEVAVATDGAARRVLYLKVVAGSGCAALAERHELLIDHVPVPRVIGVSLELGIVALEAMPGRTLRDVATDGGTLPPPAELVELSARLRRSGLVSDRSPRAFADPQRHVGLLIESAPEMERTVRRVADEAAKVEGLIGVVHGDLHAGQVLVSDGGIVGLLDVDGAGDGLLAHDAGTMIAYLHALGDLQPAAKDRCATYAETIADAYRPEVGALALARATAGAWLALATAAQRSQETDWPTTLRDRVVRAALVIDAAQR